MLLSKLLDKRLIITKAKVTSKDEAIQLLIDAFFGHYRFRLSQSEIKKAIYDRETQGGTVFPSGIAIPHARVDLFDDLIIGMVTLENPIEENGTKISCVTLMLTSPTIANLYLSVLVSFIKLSQIKDVFEGICKTKTREEIIAQIEGTGLRVKGYIPTKLKALRMVILAGLELGLEQVVARSSDYKQNSPSRDAKPIVWNQNLAIMEDQVVFLNNITEHLRMMDFSQIIDTEGEIENPENELVNAMCLEVERFASDRGFQRHCVIISQERIKKSAEIFNSLEQLTTPGL